MRKWLEKGKKKMLSREKYRMVVNKRMRRGEERVSRAHRANTFPLRSRLADVGRTLQSHTSYGALAGT